MKLTMKKSTLSTLIASLFTAAVASTAMAKAGHDSDFKHVEERKMIKIELDRENEGPVNLEIDVDGEHNIFTFTQEELDDQDAIEAKLADVDETTRETVLDALSNLNAGPGHIVFHSNSSDDNHDGSKVIKKKFVVIDGNEGGDHETIIELAKNGDFKQLHKIIESHTATGDGVHGPMVIKLDKGGNFQFNGGGEHSVNVIKKLIENGELSQTQLDEIQQMLDSKR